MNVLTIIPTMPPVTVQVQRLPTVSPTITHFQVQRVPLKFLEWKTIPNRKSTSLRPVCPSLNTLRHDPCMHNTRAAAVSQMVIQEHLNHLYHPVTGQRENYDKLNLRHTKRYITTMFNELERLASGVGHRIKSGTDTIFLSIRINSHKEGRKHMLMQSVITGN